MKIKYEETQKSGNKQKKEGIQYNIKMFQNIKYLKCLEKGNNINENMRSYIQKLHNLLNDVKDLDNGRVMLCSWKMHYIKKKIYV